MCSTGGAPDPPATASSAPKAAAGDSATETEAVTIADLPDLVLEHICLGLTVQQRWVPGQATWPPKYALAL